MSAASSSSSSAATPLVDLSALPLGRLLVRERRCLLAYEGPVFTSGGEDVSADKYDLQPVAFPEFPNLRFSPVHDNTGSLVCLAPDKQRLVLVRVADGSVAVELDNSDAQKVEFSPRGTYLITWSLPTKGTATDAPEGNLRIWHTGTGALLAAYNQKTYRSEVVQFTDDERYCFRQTTNEVCVYTNGQFAQSDCVERIQQKGFTQFRITSSWEPKVLVAFFNPEAGGKPARVTLYSFKKTIQYEVEGPLGSRTIFGASEAKLMWNKQGTALLIHSQTDVDSSNASYYGATALYIMNAKGDVSNKVEQTKEGPVHDVAWSPQGDK
jgi:translation initiation factor 2A